MMLRKAVLLALGAVGGMAIVGGAVASTARQAREDKAAATAREAAPAATPAAAPATTAVPAAQGPAAGKRVLTKKGRPGAVRERYQKELRRAARGNWKEQEGPRGSNGFDAWFYGQRSFPAGRIPEGARVNAFRSAMQRNVGPRREAGEGGAAQADLPLPSWVPIGPSTIPDGQTDTGAGSVLSPVSGRLQDIAVHPTDPNIVYAGGAQGGVWKTTNALAASPTWTPLTDKQASLATGAIAIDPRSPDTVYVGTGEAAASCDSYYGAGILKTTDGGATWTLLGGAAGGPFRNYAISKIVIDPTIGSQTIWATTTLGFYSSGTSQCAAAPTTRNGGLWRSDDNGVTWTVQDVPTGAAASVGAQIHDMVLSPDDATGNTLYVAVRSFPTAAAGGVWKTTNAKASPPTYTKVGNGFANTANANPGIRRITVGIGGAGSGDTLYAALGNTSSNLWGLYKTTDGGATWGHVDNGNNGTANVAGGSRTVVRVTGPSFTSLMVGRRIVINNTYSRTVASVAGDGNSLTFSAGEATFSSLVGATWSVGTYPRYCDGQCFYDMTVGVDPLDANVVYVGGNPQRFNDDKASLGASCTTSSACPAHSVWRTDDGGLTWRGVSQGDGVTGGLHVDDHAIVFDPSVSPSRVFNGNDGGIWRSDDKGASWDSMNTNIAITQFQSVGLHPSNPGIVIGGTQDNGTNILNPGLETPPAWFHADFGDGGQAFIDQSNPERMLHTYYNSAFLFMGPAKSTIGGAGGPGSWEFVGSYYGYGTYYYNGMDPTDPVSFYAPLAQHPAYSPNVVYFGSNKLYRSPDPQAPFGVESWTAVSPALTKDPTNYGAYLSAIGVLPQLVAGQEVIYTGASDGRIAVTKNVNTTTTAATAVWTAIDKAPLPARFVTDIEVAESDPTGNTAYATFSGFNSGTPTAPGHVFKTVNGLAASPTWTNITGDLPDVPTNAVALLPTATGDQILVGTDIGVFWSDNGGANWKYLTDGHPVVAVFALDRSRTTGQIVSSTHGRGMFELRTGTGGGPGDTTPPVCGGAFDGGNPALFNGNATDNVGIAAVQLLPGASPFVTLGSVQYSGSAAVSYVLTNAQSTCAAAATVQVTDPAGYFCRTTASYPGSPIPAKPVAENSGPVTAGTPLLLTASTVGGATYAWTGPNGFTSTSQNPTITVPTTAASGVYKVKVTVGGCFSEEATTTVVVRALPSDFNANASTDILWQNQVNGDLYIWYLNGTVTSTAAYTNPKGFSSTTWQIRGLTDLNDDGKVDIFWQNISTGDLYVWFLDTAGTVTGGSYLTPSKFADTNWRVSGLVDFNGDGDEDILWRNLTTGQMYVWYLDNLVVSGGDYLRDGSGAVVSLPGTAWEVRGLADFDGDGKPDLLWRNQAAGDLYVWFLNGPTLTGGAYLSPATLADPNWKIVRVADLNADGQADILWHNVAGGDLYVWFMNGTALSSATYLTPSNFPGTTWAVVPK